MIIYLDSLNLHDPNNGYILTGPYDGFMSPNIEISGYPKAGQDGSKLTNAYSRDRLLTWEGVIHGNTNADMRQRRQALSRLTLPQHNNGLVDRTLRIIDLDGSDYTITGQVASFSAKLKYALMAEYQLQFRASDFPIYSTATNSVTISPASGGFFSIPFSIPFSLGYGTTGDQTCTNNGDVNTAPIITLNGPLTNPRIYNVTTGDFVELNLTIGLGSSVVIDLKNNTIIQDGVTNRIGVMSSDSTWWILQPGNNTIRLTTSILGEAGSAIVTWHDAYAGI